MVLCATNLESVFKICKHLVYDQNLNRCLPKRAPIHTHTHTQPLYHCPHHPLLPPHACSDPLCACHFMPWTCYASLTLPPFPCPCRCVLNACSSYRCHSGVWPGLCRSLPGVAQLAAQLNKEHELRQPCLPQDHWRRRRR